MKTSSRLLFAILTVITFTAAFTGYSNNQSMNTGRASSTPTQPPAVYPNLIVQPFYEVAARGNGGSRPDQTVTHKPAPLALVNGILNKESAQENDRSSEYSRLVRQWVSGEDYRATALGLLEYRRKFGGTPDVDFMIASSFCRVPGNEQSGYDRFRAMLREYRLDEPSRRLIQEQLKARPESRQRITFHRERGGWVASVQGQFTRFQPTDFASAVFTGTLSTVKAFFNDRNSGDALDSVPNVSDLTFAMSEAVSRNDDEGVKILSFLLERGADAKGHHGQQALREAALRGKVRAVRLLIEHGAKPEARPLSLAASRRDREGVAIAKLLIEKGAGINTIVLPEYDTALLAAARDGRPDMVRLLLKNRASVNARYGSKSPLKVQEFDAGVVGKIKVFEGSVRIYEVGSTPLIFAAGRVGGEGSDIVKLLLRHGASIGGLDGVKALLGAAASGNVETLRLLVASGVSVNAQNEAGTTALMVAAECGRTEAVQFLLDQRADRLLKNNMNKTASDVASEYGYADVIRMLK